MQTSSNMHKADGEAVVLSYKKENQYLFIINEYSENT